MANVIDQKAYLQKYLSGGADKKKRSDKKKRKIKGNGFKIIDDDVGITKMKSLDEQEMDIMGQGEDGPQIVGVIDERSEELKYLEDYKYSTKWKGLGQEDNVSPPRSGTDSSDKMKKTLEGKAAGLQNAKQLLLENESFRRKEDEIFKKMSDEASGRNAKVVYRKGKRDTSEDREKKKEKAKKQKDLEEKYKKWNKGIKQTEAQEERLKDYLHEASKPLARFKDDKDLESNLRMEERMGDPMLDYIRERKREQGLLGPERPLYKGNFPPNRFNIRPGYRWDGVVRSNGYEKKYFEQQSKRKALQEEAYKWSSADL